MRRTLIDPSLHDGDQAQPEAPPSWIRLAVHVEHLAPVDVTVDELARADDAVAEWMYQHSLRELGRHRGPTTED